MSGRAGLRGLRERVGRHLPKGLAHKAVPDYDEPAHVVRRRRQVVAGTTLVGTTLLGASLQSPPDSRQFYGLTAATAATWVGGALASGPLHLGWVELRSDKLVRPVLTPIATGAAAFGAFYVAALVSRRIPVLRDAISSVLSFADAGRPSAVLATTLVNGLAEEVFFRGAVYEAVAPTYPVFQSTATYTLVTTATRNPSLVLAGAVTSTLFGLQRRATGGIQAPVLTHLTWSALMLRYLPPLFGQRLGRSGGRAGEGGVAGSEA